MNVKVSRVKMGLHARTNRTTLSVIVLRAITATFVKHVSLCILDVLTSGFVIYL